MIAIINRVGVALVYCALLSWIYLNEIVLNWQYMGFVGDYSMGAMILSLIMTAVLAILTPHNKDTRSIIITAMQYLLFIPYIIFLTYSGGSTDLYLSFFIMISCIYFVSAVEISAPVLILLSPKYILVFVFSAIFAALAIQAAFGGLTEFNLDIERVYEFRREAASELPGIFGYVYSNVASVLVPLALVLSFKFKNYWLVAAALLSSVVLMGMSHHKSVLFGPVAVAVLYVIFARMRSVSLIGAMFLAIPVVCILEIFYLRVGLHSTEAAYINSLIVRRVLFVPPMLDSFYTQYFGVHQWYYWSASLIGSWAIKNPHGLTPPFVIGYEYFLDTDMSANTGVIGSGFANAGLVGVAIYSFLAGLLLSLLNAFGKRIGHAFVAAASIATMSNILSSTDLLTAILTHGLLLLVIMLALFPSETGGS